MAITVAGGTPLPLSFPLNNESFLEDLVMMFDGNGVNVTSGAAAVAAAAVVGRIMNFNSMGALAGTTYTLPAAVGSGVRIMFYVSALATSLAHAIVTSPTTDTFQGIIMGTRTDSGNAVLGFAGVAGGSNSNKISLNRTTTGSVNIGEHVEVYDVATGIWLVRGVLSATGAAFATPFSHV